MKIRHRVLIACAAVVPLVFSTNATANAQDLVQTSNEAVVASTYGQLQNPIVAPFAIFSTMSVLVAHFFVWCPVATNSGWIDPYSGECTF